MTQVTHTTIPFAFLVSLFEALAAIKPKKANHTPKSNYKDLALRTLQNWITELHRRHSPLPPETTAVLFRLLFPEEDIQRKYGMQEQTLCDYLREIFSPGVPGAVCEWDRVVQAQEVQHAACLGEKVKKALEAMPSSNEDSLSMHEVDALLTELARTCAFSAHSIRHSADNKSVSVVTTKRSPRNILRTLYTSISPSSAGFLTQIILKDLRPILYPLIETHYTTSLLQYNSKAVAMLTKEDVMRAWDTSGIMLKMYRVRANLWDVADEFERESGTGERGGIRPRIGVPVQIPKCIKGRSCKDALRHLHKSKKVWVETKYDGERAQIHVEVDQLTLKSRITIFSKSKRDSTMDRYGVHHIIRETLGLPEDDAIGSSRSGAHTPRIKTNVILEAEMVAFSDSLDKVDEFWRIRSLIGSTAKGVRYRPQKPRLEKQLEDDDDCSQLSLVSNASDSGTRHLALVFFDILLIDNQSLLYHTYARRRELLENLIIRKHGYAMLAERACVETGGRMGGGAEEMVRVFAGLLSRHEEGAVLKAEEGVYGGWGVSAWVKLKADYIPDYGDTVDLALIGAGWDKDRAAELRVDSSVYTTFFLAALVSPEDVIADPTNPQLAASTMRKPHFSGIFKTSYGLDREQLEELNFMIRSSDIVEYPSSSSEVGKRKRKRGSESVETLPEMPYTVDIPASLKGNAGPSVLLEAPLLAELYGAGFTKANGNMFYELRFPRITKIFRRSERPWITHCLSYDELQRIARESVGRDKSTKDVEDWCSELWGKTASLGVNSSQRRREREEAWVDKLGEVDGLSAVGRRKRVKVDGSVREVEGNAVPDAKTATIEIDKKYEGMAKRGSVPHSAELAESVRALGSLTNVLGGLQAGSHESPSSPPERPIVSSSFDSACVQVCPETIGQKETTCATSSVADEMHTRTNPNIGREILQPKNMTTRSVAVEKGPISIHNTLSTPPLSPTSKHPVILATSTPNAHNISHPLAFNLKPKLKYDHTPFAHFLSQAIVWLYRPHPTSRPSRPLWRVPTKDIIPPGQQVHSFDAFAMACGWSESGWEGAGRGACGWVERGVVFVDSDEPEGTWMDGSLKRLIERRKELLKSELKVMKPVFVFDMKALAKEEVEREGNVEGRALCRLG